MLERSVLDIVRTKPTRPKERKLPALNDCPFCGSQAEYYQTQSQSAGHGMSMDTAGVKCTVCPANLLQGNYANNEVLSRKMSMADQWNRRES